MYDPTTLFSYESHVDPRRVHARVLLVTLGSFADAGHAQRLIDDHLRNTLTSHQLGSFDADQVVSYRDQRPTILFSSDQFGQYRTPSLGLYEVKDAVGENFLLLAGPEPGLQWERMAAAITEIVDRHDVALIVVVGSMPMPAPHTRPVVVSKWATRSELLPGNKPLFGTILMSSSFPLMMAQRLGEKEHDVIGLTAHVPHYLADTDFPDAAIALIGGIEDVAKLKIPTIQLAVAAGVVRAQIGHQVSQSVELGEHVEQLEQSYDEFHRQRELSAAEEQLPSADEIGEAAEEFLKTLGEDGPAAPTPEASTDPDANAPDDGPDAAASGDATPTE